MKRVVCLMMVSLLLLSLISLACAEEHEVKTAVYEKPRVINMTDLLADPDDEQSLVRMFVTCDRVDLEGVIVTTSCWRRHQDQQGMDRLQAIVNAYGEVLPNLLVHSPDYPSLEYVQSVCVFGQLGYGMDCVGEGHDTTGSDLIIAAVDKDDPRPVWVNCWGGANTLAQALWRVRNDRTPEEVARFVSRLRVYDVLGQDDAGAWIVTNFPELFYIRSLQVYGIGGSENMRSDIYLQTNIISHGPLGALYPLRTYGAYEGDSPSFLYQMPTGMNDPEHIDWGSWGGRFIWEKQANIPGMSAVTGEENYSPYLMYGDAPEKNYAIGRWQTSYQKDFAARMDWSVTPVYEDANHHPIAVLNGDTTTSILHMTVQPGEQVSLSAVGSSDPDGDRLSYYWYIYKEPGTYQGSIKLTNSRTKEATLQIPKDSAGKTLHVILEVCDNGQPNLYAFRRLVIAVASQD